jgi:hypothetical protein
MSEAQLQAAIVGMARLLGWRTYHTHDSRRSDPGFPDLVLVRRDRLVVAELKTEKGKLVAAQTGWLAAFIEARVETFVWRPADWWSGAIEEVLR